MINFHQTYPTNFISTNNQIILEDCDMTSREHWSGFVQKRM